VNPVYRAGLLRSAAGGGVVVVGRPQGSQLKTGTQGGPDGLGTRKWKSEDEPQVEEPSEIHKAWRG